MPGLFTAARVCEQVRAAIQSLPRGQKNAGGDGPDPAANLPLRAAAERLPRYRAADDLGDDEHGENSAIASTIGLADMAAQAGKLLDYSAHARGLLPPSPAYVFINAVIMLIMYVVERKVRLPRQYGRQIMYDFDWSSIVPSMPYLLAGLVITLKITVIAIVVGIVWGTLLAVMRLSSFLPLARFAKSYVNVFRSIPLVMVLLWFYLIVPGFLQNVLGLSPKRIFA